MNLSSVRRVDTQTSGPFGRGFAFEALEPTAMGELQTATLQTRIHLTCWKKKKNSCFVRARDNTDKATFKARVLVSSFLSVPAQRDLFTMVALMITFLIQKQGENVTVSRIVSKTVLRN